MVQYLLNSYPFPDVDGQEDEKGRTGMLFLERVLETRDYKDIPIGYVCHFYLFYE